MKENQVDEGNKNMYGISNKDIWEMFYTRLENDNKLFWGRLPFFITIFGLCVTGYGFVLLKLLDTSISSNPSYWAYHCLLIFITFIGYIVALFWVIISKASRYWYERYNETLHALERPHENELTLDKDKKEISKVNPTDSTKNYPPTDQEKAEYHKIFSDNDMHTPYNLFYLADVPGRKLSKNIFSKSSFHYSIGNTQIVMGQLLMGLWGCLFCAHIWALSHKDTKKTIQSLMDNLPETLMPICGFIIGIALLYGITRCILSILKTDGTSNYYLIRKKLREGNNG
ncbi:MAG: hypothetical protein ACRCY4_02530 [Brevinema sp.]